MDVPQPADQAPRPKDRTNALLLGCLGIGVVVVIAVVLFSIWMYRNVKTWGSDFARNQIVQVIEDSELPEEQKTELVHEVDRLTQGFKDGKISMEKLGEVIENLTEGPLVHVLAVYFAQDKYVAPSDLSDEDKEAARRTLQRFARGIFEETIDSKEAESALEPLKEATPDGEWKLKENPTTEELQAFLDEALRLADENGVPDEPFEVDVAGEFRQAIDEALGEEK